MSSLSSSDSQGRIHPTSVIHPRAQLHESVRVGPHSVIGEHVQIGADTVIGPQVVIDGWTTIGERNQIFPGAVLGMEPQDLKYGGAATRLIIGNDNRIREYVTIHRATHAEEATVIGNENLLMAYVHVAHNCVIEDQVIITNAVSLAGHIHIESQARIGGMVGIHQFTHIGKLAMVGAMSRIDRDVPPYMRVEGHPGRIRGLNLVGLKRAQSAGISLTKLKAAYRVLYRSDLLLDKALQTLRDSADSQEILHLLHFLEASLTQPQRRGPLPPQRGSRSADETDAD
ncbi:MAG: acyl-ACP--UDP-N-acetylglucosamine O-acyltransferase [Cyanobacteriota bacterium]|nr:acyl-ACP--UDP-N-acetylglucosamine O-acyltransferase [Cyanobacteriota bacterium]